MLNRFTNFLYETVLLMASIGPRKKASASLLIVKTDEIGDYILWRNFLPEIAHAEEWKGYHISFCGNQSWQSIFTLFDKHDVQQEYWLDKTRFKKDLRYRYRFLRNIYTSNFDTVINPIYSRDRLNDDTIVRASKAARRIGMVASVESTLADKKANAVTLYTSLYEHPEGPEFEFYRNRAFTGYLTGIVSAVKNTKMDTSLLPPLPLSVSGDYFVIVPGSRNPLRRWPAENFVRMASYLHQQKGWTAIVCGGPGDIAETKAFVNAYPHHVLDLTGKTSLPVLLTILKNAKMLVSVDTGAVHLAAAVGCPVLGIFNGSHYGRFGPYPAEVAADFFTVYPDEIDQEVKDPAHAIQRYNYELNQLQGDVTVEKVIGVLNHFIKEHS